MVEYIFLRSLMIVAPWLCGEW